MRELPRRTIGLALGLVLIAGCSSPRSESLDSGAALDAGVDAGNPVVTYVASYRAAYCDRTSRCRQLAKYLTDECNETEGSANPYFGQPVSANLDVAVARGRASFDPAKAAQCLSLVQG